MQGMNPAQMAQLQLAQQQQLQHLAATNPVMFQQLVAQQRAAMAAAAAGGGAGAAARGAPAATKGAGAGAPAAATAAVRTAEAVPAKKASGGKKRRAADLRLPEHGDLLIPDSPLFVQLQDAERRVDMLISRKRHELQEMFASFKRGPPGSAAAAGSVRRTLRMYVRSEHRHQGAAADAAEPPSWTLSISGRLLPAKPGKSDVETEGHTHKHHFTHYLRRLEVALDPAQYPGDAGRLVWDKARHEREQRDAVQLSRLGSAPVEVTIRLELDHQPVQWKLSPLLAATLGCKPQQSLPFVLQMLWGYIKAHNLYEPTDKGTITFRCDGALRELFGADAVELSRAAEALKPHLTAPDPVEIRYTVRPDGPASAHPDCYDFEFEVPRSFELPSYASRAQARWQEVDALDSQLNGCLQRLAEHRRRRTLLLAFAQSPVDFINAMVAAQGRELRGSTGREGDAMEVLPAGDVFKGRWVDECVMQYLDRKREALVQQQQAAQQAAAVQQQQAAAMAAVQQQVAAAQQQAAMQAAQQQAAMAAAQQQAALAAQQAAQQAQQQAAAAMAAGGQPGAAAQVKPPL